MGDYSNYIKCGQVLLSPSINQENKYILNCHDCDEYLDDLFELIGHWRNKHFFDGNVRDIHTVDETTAADPLDINNDQEYMFMAKRESPRPGDGPNLEPIVKNEPLDDNVHGRDPYMLGKLEEMEPVDVKEAIICANANQDPLNNTTIQIKEENIDADDMSWEDNKYPDENEWEKNDEELSEIEIESYSKFVNDFMNTRPNGLAFIRALKNNPQLWDNELIKNIKPQQRPIYLQQIVSEVQMETSVLLSLEQTSAIVAYLRLKYKWTTGEIIEPDWFFEHLEFLHVPVRMISLSEFGNNNLNSQQIIQILRIYETFPCLWNSDLMEYCCNNKRTEALENMQQILECEMLMKVGINELKFYLNNVHLFCTKQKRLQGMPSREDPEAKYFQYIQYLRDYVAPYECSECKKVISNPFSLKIHRSKHDGSIPLKCSLCQKPFTEKNTYIEHIRRHMKDFSFECKECGKGYVNKNSLMEHMRHSHTNERPFVCNICGSSFRNKSTFRRHKLIHDKNYSHKCPICSKGFHIKSVLNKHLQTHNETKEFICHLCNQAFKTNITLNNHLARHKGNPKVECEICGKTFSCKYNMYRHTVKHRKQMAENEEKK